MIQKNKLFENVQAMLKKADTITITDLDIRELIDRFNEFNVAHKFKSTYDEKSNPPKVILVEIIEGVHIAYEITRDNVEVKKQKC